MSPVSPDAIAECDRLWLKTLWPKISAEMCSRLDSSWWLGRSKARSYSCIAQCVFGHERHVFVYCHPAIDIQVPVLPETKDLVDALCRSSLCNTRLRLKLIDQTSALMLNILQNSPFPDWLAERHFELKMKPQKQDVLNWLASRFRKADFLFTVSSLPECFKKIAWMYLPESKKQKMSDVCDAFIDDRNDSEVFINSLFDGLKDTIAQFPDSTFRWILKLKAAMSKALMAFLVVANQKIGECKRIKIQLTSSRSQMLGELVLGENLDRNSCMQMPVLEFHESKVVLRYGAIRLAETKPERYQIKLSQQALNVYLTYSGCFQDPGVFDKLMEDTPGISWLLLNSQAKLKKLAPSFEMVAQRLQSAGFKMPGKQTQLRQLIDFVIQQATWNLTDQLSQLVQPEVEMFFDFDFIHSVISRKRKAEEMLPASNGTDATQSFHGCKLKLSGGLKARRGRIVSFVMAVRPRQLIF